LFFVFFSFLSEEEEEKSKNCLVFVKKRNGFFGLVFVVHLPPLLREAASDGLCVFAIQCFFVRGTSSTHKKALEEIGG